MPSSSTTSTASKPSGGLRPGAARFELWWLFLLPIVASAWVRGLWAPDEPRYAQVASEAWSTGSLVVMHLCGEVYPDKPPLFFWLAGLLGRLSGGSVFWMRLVSIAATAGSAACVARLARTWWGELEARWAPVIFLSCAMVAEIGGRLQIDPLLSFLVLAALAKLPSEGAEQRDAARSLRWSGLWTGLAVLAKGPVALVIVLLVAAAWRFAPAAGPRPVFAGWRTALALALLPALAWALAASLAEPRIADQLLFRQHAGRVLAEEAPHGGPVWKHLTRLPLLLLPWTPLVVLALWRAFRGERGADPRARRAAVWFLAGFLFFSLIPPKRDLYLLPLYPALALLGARELAVRARIGRLPRAVTAATGGLLGLLALAALAAAAGHARWFPEAGELVPGISWRLPLVAAPLALGVAFAAQAAREGAVERWGRCVSLGVLGMWTGVALLLFPPMDATKSARALALELAARPERPATIPCVGVQPEGYRFYGGLPAVRDGLTEALGRGGDLLALVEERSFANLPEAQRAALVVLDEHVVGSRLVYVCGRAAEVSG